MCSVVSAAAKPNAALARSYHLPFAVTTTLQNSTCGQLQQFGNCIPKTTATHRTRQPGRCRCPLADSLAWRSLKTWGQPQAFCQWCQLLSKFFFWKIFHLGKRKVQEWMARGMPVTEFLHGWVIHEGWATNPGFGVIGQCNLVHWRWDERAWDKTHFASCFVFQLFWLSAAFPTLKFLHWWTFF